MCCGDTRLKGQVYSRSQKPDSRLEKETKKRWRSEMKENFVARMEEYVPILKPGRRVRRRGLRRFSLCWQEWLPTGGGR
jgi:hypothetical protein